MMVASKILLISLLIAVTTVAKSTKTARSLFSWPWSTPTQRPRPYISGADMTNPAEYYPRQNGYNYPLHGHQGSLRGHPSGIVGYPETIGFPNGVQYPPTIGGYGNDRRAPSPYVAGSSSIYPATNRRPFGFRRIAHKKHSKRHSKRAYNDDDDNSQEQ